MQQLLTVLTLGRGLFGFVAFYRNRTLDQGADRINGRRHIRGGLE